MNEIIRTTIRKEAANPVSRAVTWLWSLRDPYREFITNISKSLNLAINSINGILVNISKSNINHDRTAVKNLRRVREMIRAVGKIVAVDIATTLAQDGNVSLLPAGAVPPANAPKGVDGKAPAGGGSSSAFSSSEPISEKDLEFYSDVQTLEIAKEKFEKSIDELLRMRAIYAGQKRGLNSIKDMLGARKVNIKVRDENGQEFEGAYSIKNATRTLLSEIRKEIGKINDIVDRIQSLDLEGAAPRDRMIKFREVRRVITHRAAVQKDLEEQYRNIMNAVNPSGLTQVHELFGTKAEKPETTIVDRKKTPTDNVEPEAEEGLESENSFTPSLTKIASTISYEELVKLAYNPEYSEELAAGLRSVKQNFFGFFGNEPEARRVNLRSGYKSILQGLINLVVIIRKTSGKKDNFAEEKARWDRVIVEYNKLVDIFNAAVDNVMVPNLSSIDIDIDESKADATPDSKTVPTERESFNELANGRTMLRRDKLDKIPSIDVLIQDLAQGKRWEYKATT